MSIAGQIHLYAAITALIAGTFVLFTRKGTRNHKRIGYLYTMAMIILLVTAFMLYSLFGGWGIFHWAAVISSATLAAGMMPIMTRKPEKFYLALHLGFMYWSVMGLYAAFFAETLVRMPDIAFFDGSPDPIFYHIVSGCLIGTMVIGTWFFIRYNRRWEEEYGRSNR